MDTNFIRERITQLRLSKGVSEYQMSYDLGHSRSYIYNISSGKALPPMAEFLAICDYLGVTPSQFFEETTDDPILLRSAIDELRKVSKDDLMMIITLARRLSKDTK
ncbi:Helix-turn-helix domain [uncultured Ruminococcus sp.]|uniref:Helix-turn-helix transcriptional regulator n=1 Tax=Massiliimalia timonensis TaxID=1987501 RepID=A0A8J6TW02_9FIRM|nr:helix-turn-helix transcriptional regulator [Massiliimalia timonensis]MBC8611923.1 helix-turn-helix transcriptional regulator [Massiliimalia timonensis]MBS7176904.1 helix-turn-helix transcriptional regulator [Clostridiales bacterium]SCG94323.1 Helix-turn-helix domain [uncultured Clostridium sp.]SCH90104.1 Helix-turn-helix domain [uncultured Ruminococcus sp.]